ncbi:MAG: hypothetical protein ACE14P_10680 [Methanotrichaceae archaeon]
MTAKYGEFASVEESKIDRSMAPEMKKFYDIISELRRRGIIVLMHRSTRWGYVVDAVIPSAKVIILKMPDLSRHYQLSMRMFIDMVDRLEGDGYRVFMVPKNGMNEAQIKTFCDRIFAKQPLATA